VIKKISVANRVDDGRKAVAAQPCCRVREAQLGEFPAEIQHV
jgi:hypothetical protein